LFEFPYILAA